MSKQVLDKRLKEEIESLTDKISVLKRKMLLFAWLRFIFFALIIALIFLFPKMPVVVFIVTEIILAAVFIVLIRKSQQFSKKLKFLKQLLAVYKERKEALNENYDIFDSGSEFINPEHDYSYDMDIFGNASVFQMLNRTVTPGGKIRLAEKLMNISVNPQNIMQKQQAVDELSRSEEFYTHFAAEARSSKVFEKQKRAETKDAYLNELLLWCGQKHVLKGRKMLTAILFVLPSLTLIAGLAWALSYMGSFFFIFMIIVQLGIISAFSRKVSSVHNSLSQKSKLFAAYAKLINRIDSRTFQSEHLKTQKKLLSAEGTGATERLKCLANLLKAFDARLNILLAFFLNALFMWDLQVLFQLEKLKEEMQVKLPKWFDAVSEFDALNSLADFAGLNPGFVYPVLSDGDFAFEIKNGAHPLLPSESRVGNDFEIKGLGKLFIITGANMSGKSTFLRTAAVNMILASTGTKVCADYMRYRPIPIYTSVRTTDSVQKNESYFYAELMRLKQMTDRLKRGDELFVILDEMLKGTNSEDKHTGSKGLLEQMIQYKVVGLAATHDTDLGKLEITYPEQILNRRFEAEIRDGELFFDYKIKQGVSRNLNAVFLMKKYGIIPSEE
jgi:DNA mismatch repair ATPase MutS